MIRITSFAKARENSGTTIINNKGYANNATTIKGGVDGVNIWGQFHDHTADISGDMSNVGNITATGNIATDGDIAARNMTATGNIKGKNAEVEKITATEGEIETISGTTADYTNINSQAVKTDYIEALNGVISDLQSTDIVVDNLTVTKAAHFFKLIIDEIKATQGQIIVTPANATVDDISYNSASGGSYALYFRATDADGKKISNTFAVGDQILCQTFNAATGTSYNVSNKFYWAKCSYVSSTAVNRTINGQSVPCHYIVIDWSDKDTNTNGVPEVGDEIVMLGNRTDSTRQAAITIGAYNNPYLDNTIKAPFIIQYDGINDYNLSSHRTNVISNGYNQFKGTFTTKTGDDIEDLINDMGEGALTYMHTAYANNATGNLNFSKTYFSNALYMGFCSNRTESDATLTYKDYTWVRIRGVDGTNGTDGNDGEDGKDGTNGTDGEEYKLVPVKEVCAIDANGTLGLSLSYNIIHIKGTDWEYISTSPSAFYVRFRPFYSTSYSLTYTNMPFYTNNPTYNNSSYQTEWKDKTSDQIQYFAVELYHYSKGIADRRQVYAQLAPAASFTITDEITATVQGHTTSINSLDGRVTTNTNSISTINQKYDSISSTVQGHTTAINNLDGRVTTNTTNISYITQTANEIKSTVTSMRVGADNLFNFTNCKWQNVVPFIQGYGIEGTSSLCRISNLGFDGVGGDFAVSCQMRMRSNSATVNVNLCDVGAENSASSFTLGTSWTEKTFVFKNVQQYIGGTSETSTSYNGFIDFEGSGINSTNRIYVKNLMITRGNVPSNFNVSSKDMVNNDADSVVTSWVISSGTVKPKNKYKGYDVYNIENPSSGYLDSIKVDNLALKENTVYTLSFYGCSHDGAIIASYLWNNGGCVNGTIGVDTSTPAEGYSSVGNASDGLTYSTLGYDYNHYIIHWYNQNSGNRSLIVSRMHPDWAEDKQSPTYITGIEFREGYWTEEQIFAQSQIRQTANEIEMKVGATGININDGTITLNADNTTIVGNLNLKEANQGLIIYDNETGAPQITVQGDKLGDLDTTDFGADKYYWSSGKWQSGSYQLPDISIGSLAAGNKIIITTARVNQNGISDTGGGTSSLSYSYKIMYGSTTVATISGTGTTQPEWIGTDGYYHIWDLKGYTGTAPAAGNYFIRLTITPNGLSSHESIPFIGTFYVRTVLNNVNKIAADGAAFVSANNRYSWFGADQTQMRYDNGGIKLDSNGVWYSPASTGSYSNWMELGSCTTITDTYPTVVSGNYYASLQHGVITVLDATGEITINLPVANSCNGKYYFIKNLSNQTVKVTERGSTSTYKAMMAANSRSTTQYISIGNAACMFVSCGLYWLQFYCG